jgi:hypothetical protein
MSPSERRERGGLYYTRTHKVSGRVTREYVGGGILGQLAARMDTEERQRREEQARIWKEEQERMEALTAPVEELCEGVEILARATLLASGYHRHNRGEWRKRRERRPR